jgi:hypothetical protein
VAIKHSTGARNGALSGTYPVGAPATYYGFVLWSVATTDPDAAFGGWLVTCVLGSPPFSPPVGGVLTANPASSGVVQSTGTAQTGGLFSGAENGSAPSTTYPRIIGTVSTAGGGGDFILSSTSLVQNGQISLTGLTYTHT